MTAIHTVGVQERSRGGADCVINVWRNMCIFQIVPFTVRKEKYHLSLIQSKGLFPSSFLQEEQSSKFLEKKKKQKKA